MIFGKKIMFFYLFGQNFLKYCLIQKIEKNVPRVVLDILLIWYDMYDSLFYFIFIFFYVWCMYDILLIYFIDMV